MKKFIYICTALINLTLLPAFAHAANPFLHGDTIVVAGNALELDITMEMLDEEDDSSSDITNVIKLPIRAMHREREKNKLQLRQGGDTSPLRQEQDSPSTIQNEIINDIAEARQEAEEAKQGALNDGMGQKKGN